jgi:membrane protease YdiL (CAAX protease family)
LKGPEGRGGDATDRVVLAWVVGVFAITGLGMLPLYVYRIDLSKLTFSSSVPIVAGIGIELTAYAPTLAALLAVTVVREPRGIRRLLRPVLRWRVAVWWYLIAVAGSAVLFLAADLLRALVHAPLPATWVTFPGAAAVAFLVGALIAGSFGEEVGWRGLGQPRLQSRYGALSAALIVGFIWGLWHLWPVLAPGGLQGTTWADGVLTVARLTAMSILFAWLLNSAQGSLLIVMLAHAGYNLGFRLVPSVTGDHADPFVVAVFVVAALAVAVVTGPRRLSRGAPPLHT